MTLAVALPADDECHRADLWGVSAADQDPGGVSHARGDGDGAVGHVGVRRDAAPENAGLQDDNHRRVARGINREPDKVARRYFYNLRDRTFLEAGTSSSRAELPPHSVGEPRCAQRCTYQFSLFCH